MLQNPLFTVALCIAFTLTLVYCISRLARYADRVSDRQKSNRETGNSNRVNAGVGTDTDIFVEGDEQ